MLDMPVIRGQSERFETYVYQLCEFSSALIMAQNKSVFLLLKIMVKIFFFLISIHGRSAIRRRLQNSGYGRLGRMVLYCEGVESFVPLSVGVCPWYYQFETRVLLSTFPFAYSQQGFFLS